MSQKLKGLIYFHFRKNSTKRQVSNPAIIPKSTNISFELSPAKGTVVSENNTGRWK